MAPSTLIENCLRSDGRRSTDHPPIFDDRDVALCELLPPTQDSFHAVVEEPAAKVLPAYFREGLVLVALVLPDGAGKKPQQMADLLQRGRVQIDIGAFGGEEVAVALRRNFLVEIRGGYGVLQVQVAGDEHVS